MDVEIKVELEAIPGERRPGLTATEVVLPEDVDCEGFWEFGSVAVDMVVDVETGRLGTSC